MTPTPAVDPFADDPAEQWPRPCPALAMFCGALGIAEREAAGRARVCCRHYWAEDEGGPAA
jgi:hypothetical protein